MVAEADEGASGTMAEFELMVTGMTCEHCEHAVTTQLTAIVGLEVVSADAETGRVRITHPTPLDRDAVADAIAEAGYSLAGWSNEADG